MLSRDPSQRTNLYLSIGCIVFALILALVWVPLDSGTGIIVKVRRQVAIGDALAPTIAAAMIGLGGLMVLLQKPAPDQSGLTLANLKFSIRFMLICAVSFALMRWAGPLTVAIANLFGDGELSYRALRDTAPWKYVGFFTGGTVLISTLIFDTEGRLSPRTVFIAVMAVLALIALYDLPFDDLLLPPNGDV